MLRGFLASVVESAGYVGARDARRLREVWRLLPHTQTVEVRLWVIPAEDIPSGRHKAIDWLVAQWRTLNAWVAERHEATGGAVDPGSASLPSR